MTDVHAHRGLNREAPENTLAAFQRAYDKGIRWIETDTDIVADGTLIVMHDAATDRTTNRAGSIYDLTAADIKKLDAGSWFSEDFAGEPVPTLHELIDFLNEHPMNLNLELKGNQQSGERAVALVEAALAELDRLDPSIEVIISSFAPLQLAEVSRRNEGIALALLADARDLRANWRATVDLCGATLIHPSTALATHETVDQYLAAGLGVNVWTINDLSTANKYRNWGCGVITDVADQLQA